MGFGDLGLCCLFGGVFLLCFGFGLGVCFGVLLDLVFGFRVGCGFWVVGFGYYFGLGFVVGLVWGWFLFG